MNSSAPNRPEDEVARGLRLRSRLVWLEVALLIALVVLGVVVFGTATGRTPGLARVLIPLCAICILTEFVVGVYLLHAACPKCGERFAPRSLVNIFVAPPPAAFARTCASCGVPR